MRVLLSLAVIVSCAWVHTAFSQSVDSLVSSAWENDPEIKSYLARQKSLKKQREKEGVLPDPTLGAGYFLSPIETRLGPQRFRFSVDQKLPWPGIYSERKEKYSLQAKAQEKQAYAKALVLEWKIRKIYYTLHVLKKNMEYSAENLKLLKALHNVARTRFETGASMVDVLRSQMEINVLENQLGDLEIKTDYYLSE